jgi:hypothetical protein
MAARLAIIEKEIHTNQQRDAFRDAGKPSTQGLMAENYIDILIVYEFAVLF